MHKLIDTLQYRTLSLIDNFGYRTVNKIVSYKVDFHILEAVYRNYYKDRILTRLVKLVKSDFDSLKKQLGLVAKIDRVDTARLTLDKIVSNSIYIIGVLTKYKSAKALSEACSMPSLQVPSHIVQIVNDINCHKRPRRIIGSNSILNCDSLKINFDTSTFSERDDSYVYFALIELNEIFKTLGFDNIMEIDDYEKLFNNHSNDFCFNTRIGRDNNDNPISLEIFLGEGFEKVDVVSAILTMPRLYDMENEKLRSVSFNLTARDYLDVVRYGKVTDIVDDDTYGLEKEIMVSKVSNVLSNTSNITTNLTRLDNGSKFNEDPDIDSTGGGSTKGPKKPDTGPDKPLGGESNIEKPQETGVKSSDRSGSTTDMGAAEGGTETDMKVQPKAAGKSNRSRGAKGKS